MRWLIFGGQVCGGAVFGLRTQPDEMAGPRGVGELDEFNRMGDVFGVFDAVAILGAGGSPGRMHHHIGDKAAHGLVERPRLRNVAGNDLDATQ